MKRWALILFVITACAAFATAARADRHTLQADPQRYPTGGVTRLEVEFPVGQLTIEGDDGDDVRVSIEVRCKRGSLERCEEKAREVRVSRRGSGGTLRLDFDGMSRVDTRGTHVYAYILVPRSLVTYVEMGVGHLEIEGVAAHLEAKLGVGELAVRGETADFHKVSAEVGIGDASLKTRGGRMQGSGFLGREVLWNDGRGPSLIKAHVGVGEARVTLD